MKQSRNTEQNRFIYRMQSYMKLRKDANIVNLVHDIKFFDRKWPAIQIHAMMMPGAEAPSDPGIMISQMWLRIFLRCAPRTSADAVIGKGI